MKKTKKFTYIFAAVIAVIVFFISSFVGGGAAIVHAATSAKEAYEKSNVLDDLKGSVINGEEFDSEKYPFNEKGTPQLVSFVEYGYSFKSEKKEDYGLYIYLYNPQGLKIDTETERNKIQFTYGEKSNWSKYVLQFLNYSEEAGYEGLFYKFKVVLSDGQRTEILNGLSQNTRVYEISGIELSVGGIVTDYGNNEGKILTHTYSGFAKGFGSELATDDTLSCTVDGLKETLSLNVHSTYWRPKGTHSDGYTKDTLHSVYFSVPNEIISEYGEMTAVHATWLNAYTAPIFVTGNKEVYDGLMQYVAEYMHGGTFKDYGSDFGYALIATKAAEGLREEEMAAMAGYYGYNVYHPTGDSLDLYGTIPYDRHIEYLNYLFYAENGDADNYVLSAEKLIGNKEKGVKGWFETFTEKFGGIYQREGGPKDPDDDVIISGPDRPAKGGLVNDKYSAVLFDKVAGAFTDVNIESTTEYKLTDNTVSDSVWDRLFGNELKAEHSYEMSAIQKVTSTDISFYSGSSAFCDKFYVAESDYDNFCSYVRTAEKKQETVYLFRYYQSEYVSNEVTEFKRVKKWAMIGGNRGTYEGADTNAYFAQEWVQLDFDIIDLTFTKDSVKTVIPVVMSPMDIAAGLDPPASTQPEKKGSGCDNASWKLILGLIAVVFIFLLLSPILIPLLGFIVKAVLWLICLPFKAIGAVFRTGKRRQRKQKETRHKPPELNGNVSPEEVDYYLDSFDWDSVDWAKLDGSDN